MSQRERPSPPNVRPLVPPPPAVCSARANLHLRPPGWESTARPTPRELSPLPTLTARGTAAETDASPAQGEIAASSDELDQLVAFHAQAEATALNADPSLDTALEELKKALLEENDDTTPPARKKKERSQKARWVRPAVIPATEEPLVTREMGETMTFWKKYDNGRDAPRTTPAWWNGTAVEAAVAQRHELQRTHCEERARLVRLIGAHDTKAAARTIARGNEGRAGDDTPRGISESLQAMGAQRKELLDARRALEKIVVTEKPGEMTAMRTLFRRNQADHFATQHPKSVPHEPLGTLTAPTSLASPSNNLCPQQEQQRLALMTLDTREAKTMSPRALAAITTPRRTDPKNLAVPVLIQAHRKEKLGARQLF